MSDIPLRPWVPGTLRGAAGLMLIGFGWLHCFWGGNVPWEAILLEKGLMQGIVNWDAWAVSDHVQNVAIPQAKQVFGAIFFITGILCLYNGPRILVTPFAFLSTLGVVFYALSKAVLKKMDALTFLEHALMMCAPLLLVLVVYFHLNGPSVRILIRYVCAMTFVCHAILALGVNFNGDLLFLKDVELVYQTPEHYRFMAQTCLDLKSEESVNFVLRAAGTMDLIAAVLVLLPTRVISGLGFIYMAGWGFLTALARPWAHLNPKQPFISLYEWAPEFLIRSPHFLVPLFMVGVLIAPRFRRTNSNEQ